MAEERKRVLVLEHDPSIADLLKSLLETEGYQVDIMLLAGPPDPFVERVRATKPDLVMVDILPTNPEEGYRLLDVLRSDPIAQRVSVVAVTTAGPLSEEAIASYNVRASVVKPFDLDELLAKLREAAGLPPLHAEVLPTAKPPLPILEQAKEILDCYSREALLRWVQRLRREEPWRGRGDLGLGMVLDRTPVLVEAVSAALQYGNPDEFFGQHPDAVERVTGHARDRRAQGIPLASLIREYTLLRDEIWLAITSHLPGPVQPSDLYSLQQAISGTMDRIVERTVPAYGEAEGRAAA